MNQKYQVEIVETLKRVVEVEAWSQGNAEAKVNEMYRKSEIVLDDGDFDNVKFGAKADGLPFFHESYRKNIENTLKDIPENKTLHFRSQISDCVACVTKGQLIDRARKEMPLYFLRAMHNVRICENGYSVEPCFNRIEQAAWDAALSEFYKDKQEWCDKYGCE